MIRFYLSEEPILNNVPTYICSRDDDRKFVLEHLHELVVKSTTNPAATACSWPSGHHAERNEFADKIREDPRNFIAQPIVELSQHPSLIGEHFEGRRIDLRPYILSGEKVVVMPGGLTRVALRRGSMVVKQLAGRRQQRHVGA